MKGLKIRAFLATMCIMSAALSGQPVKASSTNELQKGFVKAPDPQILVLDDNMDENINVSSQHIKNRDTADRLKIENLPAKYDSRALGRVTSIKDQHPYGSCWSFSIMSAMESSLISSGLYQNDLDLSELHIIKYACQSVEDPLGGTKGDSVRYMHDDKYDAGNDYILAYHILANWMGAVPEAYMKYPGNPDDLSNVSQEEAYYADIVHLQGMYILDYYDYDVIKSAIMKYGAVSASCVMDQDSVNYQNGAYYFPYSDYEPNHGITIVGWDDNYSRTNFNVDPGVDGAWLIKNSYGQDFGDNGYNWISYNDKGMQDFCYVFIAENADNYDLNYQYDGSYMESYVKAYDGVKASNIFKVDANSTKKQALKAVSFVTGTTGTDYEVQIYKNPTDEKDPESGTPLLCTPASGFAEFAGYYTVKLPEEVILNPGDTFAVVITYHGKGRIYLAAEASLNWSGYKFTASAEENTSLIYFPMRGYWEDFGATENVNLRIKAFTCFLDDSESETKRIPFTDVAETDWEYPYVCDVYEKNIMVGLSNEEFGKNRNLIRAEFVTVLYSMSGKPQLDYEEVFKDVPSGKWYTIPVVWAKKNGVTAGYGDIFGVADKITREQIVTMLYSFSGDADKETKPNIEKLDKFADADKISNWAKEAVAWSVENNMIAGKPLEQGKLFMDPKGYATRGECATIISKYLTSRNENK